MTVFIVFTVDNYDYEGEDKQVLCVTATRELAETAIADNKASIKRAHKTRHSEYHIAEATVREQ